MTRRNKFGISNTLFQEFLLEDEYQHKRFLRITLDNFNQLLKLLSFSLLPQSKVDIASQRLCSSIHIAINSSLRSFFFRFCRHWNIKNLSKFYFKCPLLLYFFKKRVQISHVSVKLVITTKTKIG